MFRRSPAGRHRLGTPGLVWCRTLPQVAVALDAPHVARRGFVERLLAGPRHLRHAWSTAPAVG